MRHSRPSQADEPVFSVIINNYNYGWCLPEAVQSIATQTFRDFELIIVDDGSTDGSLDYIHSLTVPHLFVASPNQEQARACLLSLKHARGRYVYFLDADDVAEPTLLERVAETLESEPAKIQFQLLPIDREGRILRSPWPDLPKGTPNRIDFIRDICRYGGYTTPPTSGNVFRRDVLLHIDDIDYDRAIDGVTLLLAPYCGEIISLNSPLARYRIHSGSHSAHAKPSDPSVLKRDRTRFAGRLQHLRELVVEKDLAGPLPSDGPAYLFDIDQSVLEAVLEGRRCSFAQAATFTSRVVCERGISLYSLRKLCWLLVAIGASRSFAMKIALSRRTPWGRYSPRYKRQNGIDQRAL